MKTEELRKMNEKERNKKLKELKLELAKSKVSSAKGGSSKIKEIKKIIARILTLNNGNMPKVWLA